ncbi:hypothetical protein WJX77_003179 [Trebouxia sp. C0004]
MHVKTAWATWLRLQTSVDPHASFAIELVGMQTALERQDLPSVYLPQLQLESITKTNPSMLQWGELCYGVHEHWSRGRRLVCHRAASAHLNWMTCSSPQQTKQLNYCCEESLAVDEDKDLEPAEIWVMLKIFCLGSMLVSARLWSTRINSQRMGEISHT